MEIVRLEEVVFLRLIHLCVPLEWITGMHDHLSKLKTPPKKTLRNLCEVFI